MGKLQLAAAAVLILLGAGFAWWFSEAGQFESAVSARAESLRGQGWAADFAEASVAGAPARLDLTLTEPRFGAQGWRWEGPALAARSLIYRPDFLSLSAPGRHRFATPFGAASFEARRAEASLVFGAPYPPRELARFSLALEDLVGAAEGPGPGHTIEAIAAFLRPPVQAMVDARRVFLNVKNAALGAAPPFDLEIDGAALFDRGLDQDGLGLPEIIVLNLRPGVTFDWRGTRPGQLRLAGEIARRSGSRPLRDWRGKLAFETTEAPGAAAALRALGLLDAAAAAALEARISESGRLAGVLEIDGTRVRVLDVGPEPILLSR